LIFSLDQADRFAAVNQSMCRVFALEEHKIIDKKFSELGFPGDVFRKWEELHRKVFSTGKNVEAEITSPMPDGTVRTYEGVLIPVCDEYGTVTGIRGTARDITARKKLEEEILKSDKLESISLVAGGIAHDFNNILTIVLGYISLVRSYTNKNDVTYPKLVEAEKAAQQAKSLTKQLLTFAKGGAPVKDTASIEELIKETVSFALHGSNIAYKFQFADGLPHVEVDRDQISQVLNNLINNAVQAMPRGGSINVCVENVTADQICGLPLREADYIKITISDEGEGIPEEIRLKIFDPYFTTKSTGTGLGLTTSYSIIKKHDGHITVDSKVGVGTTFNIYLPSSCGKTEQKPLLSRGAVPGRGRVLVMDDDEEIRRLTGDMLLLLGYDAEFACDGEEAVSLYSRAADAGKTFDAVILDLTIRGSIGGKHTIQKLLQIDPEIRAIVSSGYSDDTVLSNYNAFGFKGMVAKPYYVEELAEVLHRVISGSQEE
jgi:PAS domain S-box-containing protein